MKPLYNALIVILTAASLGFAQKKQFIESESGPMEKIYADTVKVAPAVIDPTGPSTYIDLTRDDMLRTDEVFRKSDPTKFPGFGTGHLLPDQVNNKYKYQQVPTDVRKERIRGIETLSTKTWDGLGDGTLWSDGNNWNPNGVPANTDSVVIDGNVIVRINGVSTCGAITVVVGSTLNIASGSLTVTQSGTGSGDMAIYGSANVYGTLDIAGNLLVAADVNGLGAFNAYSSSTVNFNGSGNQTIAMKGTGSLFNVTFQGASTTKSLDTALTVDGNFTINPSVTFSPGTNPVFIGGNMDNQGHYNGVNSTLTMNSSAAVNMYDSRGAAQATPGLFDFGGLIVNGGGKWCYDSIRVYDSLVIQSGSYFLIGDRVDRGGKVRGAGTNPRLSSNGGLYIRRTAGSGNANQNMFPDGFNEVIMQNGTTYYDANSHQIIRTTEADGDTLFYYGLYVGRQGGGQNYRKIVPEYELLFTRWTITVGPRAIMDCEGDDIQLHIGFGQTTTHVGLNVQDSASAVGGAIRFSSNNGMIRFLAPAYQSIYITNQDTVVGGSSPRSIFNDMYFEGSGGKDFVNTYNAYVRVMNDFRAFTGVSYVNVRNFEVRNTGAGSSRVFEIQDGIILYVRGTGLNGNFPSNFSTYTLGANSTVTYDAGWPNYPIQTIYGGISYGNLIMGAAGVKIFGAAIGNVRGDFQINGGDTVRSGGNNINVEGYWTNWAGTGRFEHENCTVTFTGTQEQQIRTGGQGSGKTFYNVVINKTGGNATLYGAMLVENDLYLQQGIFSTSTVNYAVRVNRNWQRDAAATYDYNLSTTTLGGSGAQSVIGTGLNDFYNLTLLRSGAPPVSRTITLDNTNSDSLHVAGNIVIDSSVTLDGNDDTLKVEGNFDNRYTGLFTAGTGKVILLGGATQAVLLGYTGQGSAQTGKMFNHLQLKKDASKTATISWFDLYIGGNLTITSGRLESNWYTGTYRDVFLGGDWNNYETFVPNTDTVHFIGTNQVLRGSGANDFYTLRFGGSGTKSLTANMDVNLDILIESGATVTMPSAANIYIGGHFYNYGSFQASNGSTVELTGTRDPQYILTNGINNYFYNLKINRINNAQGVVRIYRPAGYDSSYGNIRVINDLTIQKGLLDLSQSGDNANLYSLFLGGSFLCESDGYFYVRNAPALNFVKFEGNGVNKEIKMNSYISTAANLFNRLIFDAPSSNYKLKSDLVVGGALYLYNGTLNLFDSTTSLGYDLIYGNTNGDSLTIQGGHLIVGENSALRPYTNGAANKSYINVVTGQISLVGQAGKEALISRQDGITAGFYGFTVQAGGTIAAKNAVFEFMDSIYVNSGTVDLTNNFSSCTFTNGNNAAGACLLRIENAQNLTGSNAITGINFPTTMTATSRNIVKRSDAGNIVLVDPQGTFADSTREIDPFNRIQWNFTTLITRWLHKTDTTNLWSNAAAWSNGVPDSSRRAIIPFGNWPPLLNVTNASAYSITLKDSLILGDGSSRGRLKVLSDLSIDTTTAVLIANSASSNDSIYLLGNISKSTTGAAIRHNQKLTFNVSGISSQNINVDSLFNFVIQKTGTANLGQNILVRGDVKILKGTLDAGNYDMTVWGNWEKWDNEGDSVGVFNARTRTVTMSGTGKTIRGTGVSDFYNLTIAGSDTLVSSIDVNRTLTLNSGSYLDVGENNSGITLSGGGVTVFANNGGTFVPRTGTVLVDGSSGDQTINASGTVFNNLSFTGISNKYLSTNTIVTGNIDINLSYAGRGLLIDSTLICRGAANSFALGSSNYLYLRGLNSFPDSVETVSFNTTSLVLYQRNAPAQTVTTYLRNGNQITYPNLYLGGAATNEKKYLDSNLLVNGNLLVYNGDSLCLYSQTNRHFNVTIGGYLYLNNGQGTAGISVGTQPTTITMSRNDGVEQYIYVSRNQSPQTFWNLRFTGRGAKIITKDSINYYDRSINLLGNLTVDEIDPGTGYLNIQNFIIRGIGASNTMSLGSNVDFYLRNLAGDDTNTFPIGFETISLAPTSRVLYERGNQYIRDTTASGTQIAYGAMYLGDNGNNTNTKYLNGDVNIRGTLTIAGYTTLDVTGNNYTIRCGGNFSNNTTTGAFIPRQGRVIMDGSSTQYIYSQNLVRPFYKLNLRGTDVIINQRLDVSDTLRVESGKFSMGAQSVYCYGDWMRDSIAAIVPGTSTVYLSKNGRQSITAHGAEDFYNLVLDSAGQKTALTSLDVNGSLTIRTNDTLYMNASTDTIYLAGSWTNEGVFTHNNNTVVSDGTGGVTYQTNMTALSQALTKGFNNLTISKSNGSNLTLGAGSSDLYIGGNLTINVGDLDVNQYGTNTVYCYGDWNNVGGGFYSRTDTVYLRGKGSRTLRAGYTGVGNYIFNHLVIDSSGTYTINNYQIDVRGILQVSRGTLKTNGYNVYFSTTGLDSINIDNDGVFDIGAASTLYIYQNSRLNIGVYGTPGTFKMIGDSASAAQVTRRTGAGYYWFNVGQNGTISARYYRVEFTNANGVWVRAGAKIDSFPYNFSDGNFSYPAGLANAAALRIDSLTTKMTRQTNNGIWRTVFSVNPGGGAYNVVYSDGTDSLEFVDASGPFSDSLYERETSAGKIEWASSDPVSVWTGASSNNWFNPANWSPQGVPDGTKRVSIPNTALNDCWVDTTGNRIAECRELTIGTGTRRLIMFNDTLTVHGNVNIYGRMTFMDNRALLKVKGNWYNPGTFDNGGGKVRFDSTGNQVLVSGGITAAKQFGTLEIGSNSIVVVTTNALEIKDTLRIDSLGVLDNNNNQGIYIGKTWNNDNGGYYRAGASTVYFNGTAAQYIWTRDSADFYSLVFENSGQKTFMTNTDIRGTVTIRNSAVVNGNEKILRIRGNWDNYTTFNAQRSTVIFEGPGQNIYGGGASGTNKTRFASLWLNGTGTKTLFTGIEIDSGFLYINRTLNLQNNTVQAVSLEDSLEMTAGMILYVRGSNNFPSGFENITLDRTSYVYYDVDTNQTISTKDANDNTFSYGNLLVTNTNNGNLSSKTLDGNLITQGYLQIGTAGRDNQVTLNVDTLNYNIFVGGYFYNYGYILAGTNEVTNTITLNGSNGQQNMYPEGLGTGKTFYNLVISNTSILPNNNVVLGGIYDLLIRNNLTISNGNFNINGRDLTVLGSFNATTGAFIPGNATVYLKGSGKTWQSNTSTYNNVKITGSYTMQDNATVNGDFTLMYGSLDFNGEQLLFGNASTDNFVVDSSATLDMDAGSQLKIFNGSAVNIKNGSTVKIIGADTNQTIVTRNGAAGYYGFNVNPGSKIFAKYAKFEYVNTSGVVVDQAEIDTGASFSYCTFDNGPTDGIFLTLNNIDHAETDTLIIKEPNFPSQPAGGSYNIRKNGTNGYIIVQDATGAFEGEAFDYDLTNTVEWIYTTNNRYWTGKQNTNWHEALNWSPKAVPNRENTVIISSTSANMPVVSADTALAKTLRVSKGTLTLNGKNLWVDGNLTVDSTGTLTVQNATDTIFVSGNWSVSNTFNNGSGVVVFYGLSSQILTTGGTGSGKKFYSIDINKATGTSITLGANDLQVDRDLKILSGTFVNSSGRTITVNNTFSNAGTFTDAGGTVTLATGTAVNLTSGGTSFNNLIINKSSGSVTLQDNLTVLGNFTITAGSFYANGRIVEFGDAAADAMSVSGSAYFNTGSALRVYAGVANGSSVTVNSGGYVEFVGMSTQNVSVTRRTGGTDYYRFSVSSGGTIGAKHTTFEYMNGDGLSITTNGTSSGISATYDFDSTTFTNGKSAGTFLKMDGNFTAGDVTMLEVTFPTNPGGGAKNVTRINCTTGDTIIFYDATGAFEGDGYSSSTTTNRISWRYSTENITFDGNGIGDSLWSTPANWNPNVVPKDSGKNAIIPSGFYVVYDSNYTTNNVTLNGGTLNVRAQRKMTLTGSLNINSGTMRLNPYSNITNADTLNIKKNISIASGAALVSNSGSTASTIAKIYIGENWTCQGTFTYNLSWVIFNGDSTKTQTITSSGKPFFSIYINKTGSINSVRLGSNVETTNFLYIQKGILDFNGFDLTIRRAYQNDGTIIPGTRTATFIGNATGNYFVTGGSGVGKRFYNLNINHSNSNVVNLSPSGGGGNIYVENDLTISSTSYINTNNNDIFVGGSVDINRASNFASGDTLFLIGENTVNMYVNSVTTSALKEVVINKSGGIVNITSNNSIINGSLNVRNGEINLSGFALKYGDASADTIRIDGGNMHVDNGSTLQMRSGSGITVRQGVLQLYSSNPASLSTLTNQGSGDYAVRVYPTGQLTMGNSVLTNCNDLLVRGQLYFEPGTTSRFANGTVINIDASGRIRAVGSDTTSANRVTIKPLTGNYRIVFASNSRMTMQNVLVDSVGGSGQYGITVQSGATIDSMNNVLFRRGTGNAYVSLANDQIYTANGLQFDSAGSGRMAYNVSYTSGGGLLTLNNYKGNMSGVFFEQDNGTAPYGRATWTLNETQNVPNASTNAFGHKDFTISSVDGSGLGSTNVRMISDTLDIALFSVLRYFTVQPTNSASGTIRIHYPKQEENGQHYAQLNVWQRRNGAWKMVDTMAGVTMTMDSAETVNGQQVYYIQAAGYNFAAGTRDTIVLSRATNDASLPVVLAYFRGHSDEGKVVLEWKTESELANAYWLIQRKEITEDELNRISSGAMKAENAVAEFMMVGHIKGAGSKTSETLYEYVDSDIRSGKRYAYRIADVSYAGQITYHESVLISAELPKEFGLSQNFPNPFNPTTTIRYQLPVAARVTVKIYNVLGQEVYSLVSKTMDAGYHQIMWNGINSRQSAVASGIYIYRISAQSLDGKQKFSKSKKMMILK